MAERPVQLPRGTTQVELDQAQSLISRGKTGAAFGDPKLQRIIKALETQGFQSSQQFLERRLSTERQAEQSGITEVTPGVFRFTDPRTGKESFTSSREFAETSSVKGTPIVTREFQERFRSPGVSGIGSRTPGTLREEAIESRKASDIERKKLDIREREIVIPENIRRSLIKRDEIFNPRLNAFVRPSDPSGQSTGFIRQPTPSEVRIITQAKNKGSFVGILAKIDELSKKADEIFTPIEDIREEFEEVVKTGKTTIFTDARVKRAFDRGFTDFDLAASSNAFARDLKAERLQLKSDFPPVRVFEFGAEGLLKTSEKITGTKAPKNARETAKELLEDVLVFATFSPAIQTATSQQLESQFIYDNVKKKFVKRSELSTIQAKTEFARMTPERQSEILKLAFKNRVYLDGASLQRDVIKAAKFMKGSGLTNAQISNQLLKLFPGQSSTVLGGTAIGGVVVEVPQITQLTQLSKILSGARALQTKGNARNQQRIKLAQMTPEQRFEARQSGVSRFQAISEVGVDSRFSVISNLQNNKLKSLTKDIQDTKQKINQATNTIQKQTLINRQKLNLREMTRLNQRQNQRQLLQTTQSLNQNNRQLQRVRAIQESLTRQLSATSSVQRQQQLAKQLSSIKTIQDTLTRQDLKLKTKQKSLTKTVQKLQTKTVGLSKLGKPKDVKKGKGIIRPPFGIKKKKTTKEFSKSRPKKFQVFVRKKGKDILFKSFKTKPKARRELKKRLENTLRASGFIFDKKKGVKLKPKITKGFRLSKVDPFRIVERRGRRLDSKRETVSIQEAKRLSKTFKNKSNFKKIVPTKLNGRKNNDKGFKKIKRA